jgi:hypothetical protein
MQMHRTAHLCLRAISFCAVLLSATVAHARIGLVVGEPFGSFGTMLPVGHASIYIDNLCADTPTHLRACQPGESGVVLSRYHDLQSTHLDWIAIPAFTFFYGVDNPANVPAFVTASSESELRESYRQAHLLDIAPDRIDEQGKIHPPPYGDWQEGIGAAFDRRLFVYSLATTPQQDAALLTLLNADPNHRRYSLRRANCADFAADLLNVVLPQQKPAILHRNFLADFDFTTPKNLCRRLDAFGRAHPEVDLQVYEIPQIPGTLRRSRPLRGSAETFVKTKRYLATVIVLQPELAFADWILYETKGKWTPGRDATELSPSDWPLTRQPSSTIAATPPADPATVRPSADK